MSKEQKPHKPRSNGMMNVYHEEEPAPTEPVGMSGGTAVRLFLAGVIALAALVVWWVGF